VLFVKAKVSTHDVDVIPFFVHTIEAVVKGEEDEICTLYESAPVD
jgi:hypothetical protein